MKNLLLIGFVLGLGILVAAPVNASGGQPVRNFKLNPQNISNAAKVVARNKELFQDTEKLKAIIRISQGMQINK